MRKKRPKQKILYVCFFIFVFSISIGYAFLNIMLSIVGTVDVKGNTWDLSFENVQIRSGSVTASTPPVAGDISSGVSTVFSLKNPGEYYEFTVDVKNNGTVDAMIDTFSVTPSLDSTQKGYIDYVVTYQNGDALSKNQLIPKNGGFVRLKFRMKYKVDFTGSQTIFDNISAKILIGYVPSRGQGVAVRNNGISLIDVKSGDGFTRGSEFCIQSECFKVISSDSTTVTALAKYNLYIGYSTDENWSTTVLSSPTGLQDRTALGYGNTYPFIGTIDFSSYNQKGTNNNDYDGSIVEQEVLSYHGKIVARNVTPIETRLIKLTELESLNCTTSDCSSAPSWVRSTSYWTMTPNSSGKYYIYVMENGNINSDGYYSSKNMYGVRPVIVVLRSLFGSDITDKKIQFTIGGVSYRALEGMTWGEWLESEYNVDGFSLAESGEIINADKNKCVCIQTSAIFPVVSTETIINNTNYCFTTYTSGVETPI